MSVITTTHLSKIFTEGPTEENLPKKVILDDSGYERLPYAIVPDGDSAAKLRQ